MRFNLWKWLTGLGKPKPPKTTDVVEGPNTLSDGQIVGDGDTSRAAELFGFSQIGGDAAKPKEEVGESDATSND